MLLVCLSTWAQTKVACNSNPIFHPSILLLQSLRQELGSLRLSQNVPVEPLLTEKVQALLLSQQKQLDMSLQSSVQNSIQSSLQTFLRTREQQENQRQDKMLSVISQTVNNVIASQLPTLISREIQSEVVPSKCQSNAQC